MFKKSSCINKLTKSRPHFSQLFSFLGVALSFLEPLLGDFMRRFFLILEVMIEAIFGLMLFKDNFRVYFLINSLPTFNAILTQIALLFVIALHFWLDFQKSIS